MSRIIRATFEDGVLKPDFPLEFPPLTRVRLIVEPLINQESATPIERSGVCDELERLWDEVEIDSGMPRPSRDQLYDRY